MPLETIFDVGHQISAIKKLPDQGRILCFTPGGGTPILGHISDVRPEWVSFRGPKTCGWV